MRIWLLLLIVFGVVLCGAVIGLLSNWGNRPAWLTPFRFATLFITVVIVLAVLTVIQTVDFTSSSGGTTEGPASPVAKQSTAPPSAPGSNTQATATPGTAKSSVAGSYLADVAPDTGGGNLGELPRALRTQGGYAHSVVIHCATGQTTDQFREVTYDLGGRYINFQAIIHAYEAPPEDRVVSVSLTPDSMPPVTKDLQIGQSDAFDVNLDGVATLRLRVTCQTPNAWIILSDAFLQHA